MSDGDGINNSIDTSHGNQQEGRKALNCLFKLEELLQNMNSTANLEELFRTVIKIIPSGWQYPDITQVKIRDKDSIYTSDGYKVTPWQQRAEIKLQKKAVGQLMISYTREVPRIRGGYFLREETQLMNAIANRIGHMVEYIEMKEALRQHQEAEEKLAGKIKTTSISEWRVMVDLLQKSNPTLFMYLSQKMLHYLCWNGVEEARQLLEQTGSGGSGSTRSPLSLDDENQPIRKESMDHIITTNNEIFRIASENLGEDQILNHIHRWLEEDKSRFLVKVLENPNSSLTDLINAITQFQYLEDEGIKLSTAIEKSLRVSLVRYFFSDQLEFINVAKNHIEIKDYYELVKKLIFPSRSHGKLGGKSAGLFLAASEFQSFHQII